MLKHFFIIIIYLYIIIFLFYLLNVINCYKCNLYICICNFYFATKMYIDLTFNNYVEKF